MRNPDAPLPAFCLFPVAAAPDDPIFARVAAEHALGTRRPGLVLGEEQDMRRVLISAEGETARIAPAQLTTRIATDLALALMDALEEAIEDARDDPHAPPGRAERLEQTLALMERALEDER